MTAVGQIPKLPHRNTNGRFTSINGHIGFIVGRLMMTTLVVVEDEILVRIVICEDLAAEGYEVLTADNADQVIEIRESQNDITTIFTDIEMLGSMNGLKLAAAVRDR